MQHCVLQRGVICGRGGASLPQQHTHSTSHTFEVHAELHPQPQCIDHSGLNGLPHYPKLLQGHPHRTNHVVPLNQLLEQFLRSSKRLVGEEEGLDKLQVWGRKEGREGAFVLYMYVYTVLLYMNNVHVASPAFK